jgi:hypothetical protein
LARGVTNVTEPFQTPNTNTVKLGVRLRVLRFVVERETAQIVS